MTGAGGSGSGRARGPPRRRGPGGTARSAGAAALLALALAALPARGAPRCRGSLSGSATGAFSCSVDLGTRDGKTFFVITPREPIPGVPSYAPGAFEMPAPVRAGRYTLDSLGQGMASVAARGGTLYTATRTFSTRGEVTLVLARVKRDRNAGRYDVRGSYRARLVPATSGKQGEVIVEVQF